MPPITRAARKRNNLTVDDIVCSLDTDVDIDNYECYECYEKRCRKHNSSITMTVVVVTLFLFFYAVLYAYVDTHYPHYPPAWTSPTSWPWTVLRPPPLPVRTLLPSFVLYALTWFAAQVAMILFAFYALLYVVARPVLGESCPAFLGIGE